MERYLPAWLLFASEAKELVIAGAILLVFAAVALRMDRRRHRRDRLFAPDRVGWMPWTGLFLACATLGFGLIAVGLSAAIGG